MANYDAVARPYAQAVFELARESGSLDTWSQVLDAATKAVGNEDVIRLLHTPGIDTAAVATVIADVCLEAVPGAPRNEVGNFLKLLAANNRVPILLAIAERFETLKAEVENTVDVILTAATDVDDAQKARIVAALKKRFGRDVNLQFKLDETLIGGARLQADDLVIDGSVRTGLEKLASALVH